MHLNFIFSTFLIVTLLSGSNAQIALYKDAYFGGDKHVVIGRGCQNLPSSFNDEASSVDSHGYCVWLFQHAGCGGRSIKIEPGSPCHYWLGGCGLDFNDRTSSVELC